MSFSVLQRGIYANVGRNLLTSRSVSSVRRSIYPAFMRSLSSNAPETPQQPGPLSVKERLTAFFKQYGKLGLAVYIGIGGTTFGGIYLALKAGVDVKALATRIGIPDNDFWRQAGTFAVAYGLYKILLPVRLFATAALTSWIAKRTKFGRALVNKSKKQ